MALLRSESVLVRGLLAVLCACATLTTATAETRIISDQTTGNADFLAALLSATVDEVILRINVTLPYSDAHRSGIPIRRYLTVRGEQCPSGRCGINIDGTSVLPRRGFFVTGASHLTLHNVNVHGGLAREVESLSGAGTAFFIEEASCVTCVNCDISNNDAGESVGGAIFLSGHASFSCEDCTIRDNSASEGGAVSISSSSYCSAHFKNTVFTNNHAGGTNGTNGRGGAVDTVGFAVLEFDHCTFEQNRAEERGGVMHIRGGSLYFNDTIWKDNSSGQHPVLDGPLLFVEVKAAIYFENWDGEAYTTVGSGSLTRPLPLMVKKVILTIYRVTTEFAIDLVDGVQ
eukprot:CAMPEP_0198198230 /NCGR_PEP_ID=MMETSP1445-20131203/1711_1 /TAXON_ID=36898 /ORGANISM="Pyramimonas sp., Strain CCMP2087" /LENGTH=343 /DNA_ID=CAMNT_0043867727 /DNA_START=217 /DNA_END=1245 /DNA_ORIENTATION=-